MILETLGRLKSWYQEKDLRILLWSAFLAFCSLVAYKITSEVMEGETQKFDENILLMLRSTSDLAKPIGPPYLKQFFVDVTAMGSVTILTAVSVITVLFLLIIKRYKTAFYTAAAIGIAQLANIFLKSLYNRPRPMVVPHLTEVHSLSFPSGHSMMSAVVYLIIGALLATTVTDKHLKKFMVSTAIGIAVIVGISRIFLGVHYPSDVIAGWLYGLVWAIGTRMAASRYRWL